MGRAKSDTFVKYYLSQHVVVDVQAVFLDQTPRSDFLQQVGKLHLR